MKGLNALCIQPRIELLFVRADRQEWLVVLRADNYLKLVKEKENGKVPQKASSD